MTTEGQVLSGANEAKGCRKLNIGEKQLVRSSIGGADGVVSGGNERVQQVGGEGPVPFGVRYRAGQN
jgi:hypothetical protein